jgi:hypothetical protein
MEHLTWIDADLVALMGPDEVTGDGNSLIKRVPVAFDGAWIHIDLAKAERPVPGRNVVVYGMDRVRRVEYTPHPGRSDTVSRSTADADGRVHGSEQGAGHDAEHGVEFSDLDTLFGDPPTGF